MMLACLATNVNVVRGISNDSGNPLIFALRLFVMGEALNDLKIRLINRITLLKDAQLLGVLEKLLTAQLLTRDDLILITLAAPVRSKTDLNQLIAEQKYQGPDRQHFEAAVSQMGIEEPIEELLSQLTQ